MKRFQVELISATPNPQQCIYAAMHQSLGNGMRGHASIRAAWHPDHVLARGTVDHGLTAPSGLIRTIP